MNALLIIDLQVGRTDDPPRWGLDGVTERVNRLAKAIRKSDGVVIFIQHDGPPGHRLEPYTPGWQLLPTLERSPADVIIRKRACDAFYETRLEEVLKQHGVDQLLVTGGITEMCVDTTIRAAASRNYQVVVASDGHTTRDKPHLGASTTIEHHNWVWKRLILPDRDVKVLSSAQILEALSVAL